MTLIASGSNVARCLRICKGCSGVNRGRKTKTRHCAGHSGLTMRTRRWSATRGGLRYRALSRGTPGHGTGCAPLQRSYQRSCFATRIAPMGWGHCVPARAAGALYCDSRATWRDASRQGTVRLAPWSLFRATRTPVLAFPTPRIPASVVPEGIIPHASVKGGHGIAAAKGTCLATN
jgi:hypothetical protein